MGASSWHLARRLPGPYAHDETITLESEFSLANRIWPGLLLALFGLVAKPGLSPSCAPNRILIIRRQPTSIYEYAP